MLLCTHTLVILYPVETATRISHLLEISNCFCPSHIFLVLPSIFSLTIYVIFLFGEKFTQTPTHALRESTFILFVCLFVTNTFRTANVLKIAPSKETIFVFVCKWIFLVLCIFTIHTHIQIL